jgi:hypothetical protein
VIAIISTGRALTGFYMRHFGHGVLDMVTGADRIYVLHRAASRGSNMRYTDPTDGELLVECRFFETEAAGRQWIADDIAGRDARAERVQ